MICSAVLTKREERESNLVNKQRSGSPPPYDAMQPAQCKTKDDCLQWILSHLHWNEYTKTDELDSEEWLLQANSDRMGFVVIEIYKQKMTGRWTWIVGEEYGKPIRLTDEFKTEDISEDLTSLFDQMSRTYQRSWKL